MKTSYDIIKTLVRTEKATMLEAQRKYFFEVSSRANKIEIKQSVEEIYKVKVDSVNTSIVCGKLKQVRNKRGNTTPWKRAAVTLKEGHKIDVT